MKCMYMQTNPELQIHVLSSEAFRLLFRNHYISMDTLKKLLDIRFFLKVILISFLKIVHLSIDQ